MKGFADLLFLRWSGMPVNSLQKTRFYVGGIPQRLKPRMILHDLQRGLKPRPFKAKPPFEASALHHRDSPRMGLRPRHTEPCFSKQGRGHSRQSRGLAEQSGYGR
jgi:hypothetical protein